MRPTFQIQSSDAYLFEDRAFSISNGGDGDEGSVKSEIRIIKSFDNGNAIQQSHSFGVQFHLGHSEFDE
jgi:hypothetical protein